MNLHVIAYPDLPEEAYGKIQANRQLHNSLYNVIEPHFTIVFSVPDMEVGNFVSEIKKQACNMRVIDFCLSCAVINKDAFSDSYDAFLVPDEGFSSISKLHDKLYSDKLSKHHRLDISYLPHISIANSPDPMKIKEIVYQWNKEDFSIHGSILSLDIINYENRVVSTVEKIYLESARH